MTSHWEDDAACKGMDTMLFFPEQGGKIHPDVKAACERCTVTKFCLSEAMRIADTTGIWANTTHRQRKISRRTKLKEKKK